MALTFANMTANSDVTAGHTAITTASVDFVAGKVYFLSFMSKISTVTNPPVITGTGTWTLVVDTISLSGTYPLHMWRFAPGSNVSGTVTVTLADAKTSNASIWAITEASGADNSGTNGSNAVVQTQKARVVSGTVITVTFDTPITTGNGGLAAFSTGAGNVPSTPDTGWTELNDFGISGVSRLAVHYRPDTDTDAVATYGSTIAILGLGIEVKTAAAAAGAARHYYAQM